MHEGGEANATLDRRGFILDAITLAPRVIIADFEGTSEHLLHIDFVLHHLASGRLFTLLEEVAATQFFRT